MPTARDALFATISTLGESLVVKEGGGQDVWEIWFAGDDFGLKAEQFQAMLEDEEGGYLYESRCLAKIQGEATIKGIEMQRQPDGLNLLTLFMRLLESNMDYPAGEFVDVDFELRPSGDKILVDVIALEVAWAPDGPDPDAAPDRRKIGEFAYDAERGYIAAREPEPRRPVKGRADDDWQRQLYGGHFVD